MLYICLSVRFARTRGWFYFVFYVCEPLFVLTGRAGLPDTTFSLLLLGLIVLYPAVHLTLSRCIRTYLAVYPDVSTVSRCISPHRIAPSRLEQRDVTQNTTYNTIQIQIQSKTSGREEGCISIVIYRYRYIVTLHTCTITIMPDLKIYNNSI